MAPEDKITKQKLIIHDIKHYRQRYNWDCGVTCVLMVLPEYQRKELIENFTTICEEEGFNQSTWTIDLCYLLKRFNISHHMYTTMLGVNEEYRIHGYYKKILDLDRERVGRRFAEARSAGLLVSGRAVSAGELARHVAAAGPALALVDGARLACDLCRHNQLRAELRRWVGGGYVGHYVVVAGLWRGRVLYCDPAVGARVCAARLARLWAAATAPGTDNDVVLISYTPAAHPGGTDATTVSTDTTHVPTNKTSLVPTEKHPHLFTKKIRKPTNMTTLLPTNEATHKISTNITTHTSTNAATRSLTRTTTHKPSNTTTRSPPLNLQTAPTRTSQTSLNSPAQTTSHTPTSYAPKSPLIPRQSCINTQTNVHTIKQLSVQKPSATTTHSLIHATPQKPRQSSHSLTKTTPHKPAQTSHTPFQMTSLARALTTTDIPTQTTSHKPAQTLHTLTQKTANKPIQTSL